MDDNTALVWIIAIAAATIVAVVWAAAWLGARTASKNKDEK
jgi:hypothetical protein